MSTTSQKFGKYQLIHRIAVGGMAEIFVARSEGMEGFKKTVVIKRIRPHLSGRTEFVTMFLNEAKLAAQLNHSNIAQIYDLGRIGDCFFIAMEYVQGRDMRTIVPKAEKMDIPFPMEYSLKIASEACEGLYYAHRKTDEDGNPLNIVHRDVTPENIMVSFDGEVKLLDFGIAKAENLVSETRAGEIKGKLGYLSPEQVTCKNVDQRSDLFSLGTVLYEWITGYKLFGGGSDVEVLRNVVEGKIYPPSYFKEDIPEAVENILMRALKRNREERYQTAWEMKFDLDQFLARHEFTPSSIHLSNFLRQIYHDELAEETRRLGGGLEHVFETGEAGTDLISAERVKRAQTGTRSEKPVMLEKPKTGPIAAGPDAIEAELLVPRDGHLKVTLDIEKKEAERLKAVAERNHMTLAELIQDLLRQFTKYMD